MKNETETQRRTRTACYCEQCRHHFAVTHGEHDAVYQVRNGIEDAHDAASPDCHERHGLRFVRAAL